MSVQAPDFSKVTVSEVKSVKSKSWSPSHRVRDDLNKLLLFKRIDHVLVALHVELSKLYFPELEVKFKLKQVAQDFLSVLCVHDLVDITIV